MDEDWGSVCTLGWDTLNENEERAFGGFLVESDYNPDDFDFIQVQVPVGVQRMAGKNEEIESNLTLEDVLSPMEYAECVEGFPTEKEISNKWGAITVSGTAKVDVISVLKDSIYVIEIKTREQKIEGIHDVYEGFGQVLMNLDRFEEDYPSIYQKREVRGLLLGEESNVDIRRIKDSFLKRKIGFFDPRRGVF